MSLRFWIAVPFFLEFIEDLYTICLQFKYYLSYARSNIDIIPSSSLGCNRVAIT